MSKLLACQKEQTSNSTSDKIIWKNMTLQKLFQRNKGEFCREEHNVRASTDDLSPQQQLRRQRKTVTLGAGCLLVEFSAFPCFPKVCSPERIRSASRVVSGGSGGRRAEGARPGLWVPPCWCPVQPTGRSPGKEEDLLGDQPQTKCTGAANLCLILLSHHVIKSEDSS